MTSDLACILENEGWGGGFGGVHSHLCCVHVVMLMHYCLSFTVTLVDMGAPCSSGCVVWCAMATRCGAERGRVGEGGEQGGAVQRHIQSCREGQA